MRKARNNDKIKAQKAARSEFGSAIAQIAAERKIEPSDIYIAIEAGLLAAYRKQAGGENETPLDFSYFYWAKVDQISGSMQIFRAPKLKPDDEDDTTYDENKVEDVTPIGFGRIAAQLAKQIILQKMRDAERDQIINDYQNQLGTLTTAQVLRMEGRNVLMDIGRGNASMPPKEQMRGEYYKPNARMAVLIKEIGEVGNKKTIIVSRADAKLVALLFTREVPEIAAGSVSINLIAREAGVRTKIAVASDNSTNIDPVGSCVGQRGVRVQEIIKELNNEKIDIIPYHENMIEMIGAALAPAENLKIDYNEKNKAAQITAPADQMSLVIGKSGQNVRLAAKLLGISITVKNEEGEIANRVTGEEEYEIDSFDLQPETKEELINIKLTNSGDILRFKNKIEENEKISEAEKEIIFAKAKKQMMADEIES